jgi:hypothetical protein
MSGTTSASSSSDTKTKDAALRLRECQSMYTKLQSMGVFQDPASRDSVKTASNTFVRDGASTSCRIKVRLGDGTDELVRIVFSARKDRQSGIELLR